MLIGYVYKLDPSRNQAATMEKHIEMLRLQYNFRIRERTEAYAQASHPVMGNYCDLETKAECCPLACSVSKSALYGDPWTTDKKTGGAKLRSARITTRRRFTKPESSTSVVSADSASCVAADVAAR